MQYQPLLNYNANPTSLQSSFGNTSNNLLSSNNGNNNSYNQFGNTTSLYSSTLGLGTNPLVSSIQSVQQSATNMGKLGTSLLPNPIARSIPQSALGNSTNTSDININSSLLFKGTNFD